MVAADLADTKRLGDRKVKVIEDPSGGFSRARAANAGAAAASGE